MNPNQLGTPIHQRRTEVWSSGQLIEWMNSDIDLGALLTTQLSINNAMPNPKAENQHGVQTASLNLFPAKQWNKIYCLTNRVPDSCAFPKTSAIETLQKKKGANVVELEFIFVEPKSLLTIETFDAPTLEWCMLNFNKHSVEVLNKCQLIKNNIIMKSTPTDADMRKVSEVDLFMTVFGGNINKTIIEKGEIISACQELASLGWYKLQTYRFNDALNIEPIRFDDFPLITPEYTLAPIHNYCRQSKTTPNLPGGIGNRGNFCWLSSLLQIMARNTHVADIIDSYEHELYMACQISIQSSFTSSTTSTTSSPSSISSTSSTSASNAQLVRSLSDATTLSRDRMFVTPASRVAKHMKECFDLLNNGTARAIDIASDSSLGHPNIECCNLYSRICDLVPSRIWLQQMDPSELFFQQILEPLDNALKEGGVTTTIASIFGYTTAPVEYRGGNAVAASSSSSSRSTIQTVMSLSKGSGDVMDGINQAPTLKRMISPQGSGESDAVRNDWGMYSALDMLFGWEERTSDDRGTFQQRVLLKTTPQTLCTQLPTTDLRTRFWFDNNLFLDQYVASSDGNASVSSSAFPVRSNSNHSPFVTNFKDLEHKLRDLQSKIDLAEKAVASVSEIESTIQNQHGTTEINDNHILKPFIIEGLRLKLLLVRMQKEKRILRQEMENKLFAHSQYHYRLAAIIVRRGDASGGASGHYYAYIRGAIDWIKCDDHNVDVVNEDEMLKIARGGNNNESDIAERAHLLFWEKVDGKEKSKAGEKRKRGQVEKGNAKS